MFTNTQCSHPPHHSQWGASTLLLMSSPGVSFYTTVCGHAEPLTWLVKSTLHRGALLAKKLKIMALKWISNSGMFLGTCKKKILHHLNTASPISLRSLSFWLI